MGSLMEESYEDYYSYEKENLRILKRTDSAGSVGESSLESTDSDSGYFTYEDHCGPGLKASLLRRLESGLGALEISQFILERIVEDILRLSEDEPYGVRGATVIFYVRDLEGRETRMASMILDETRVSTFRLIFILKEHDIYSRITGILRSMFFMPKGVKPPNAPFKIGSQYQSIKRKLYRFSDSYF